MNQTNWMPGLVVLAGGLVIAALYLLLTGKKGAAAADAKPRDGKLDDLDRRAQLLIEQLRELEQEKHQLDPARYSAEKSRLELEAAGALRERDQYAKGLAEKKPEPAKPSASPAPTGFFGKHPEWKGALWGGGVVLFFAVLAFTLYSSLKPRSEGQEATGINPNEQMGRRGPMQQPQSDPELESALARANNDPSNVELAAEVSHELIRVQRFQEAEKLTRRALGVDPFHVENRIHLQVIRATEGQEADAQKELQRISDTAPDAYEATLFLGVMAMQRGDKVATLEYFERFASEAPKEEQPPQLLQGIAMLRQQLGRN